MSSTTPSFTRAPTPARPRSRGEIATTALLALALLAQVLWLQRDVLAASAQWRPWVEAACGVLRCTLPPWREPEAFSMLSRDVIAVPDRAGVLRVQASLRNDARWAQPWPTLRLSLSDANGNALGARRFQPSDYLRDVQQAPALLAPGEPAQIAFDIVEPSTVAVAFDFRFE